MRFRFFYEYEEDTQEYAILEEDGGCEHGAYYDVAHFWVSTQENAQDAVNLLNKLYKEKKE